MLAAADVVSAFPRMSGGICRKTYPIRQERAVTDAATCSHSTLSGRVCDCQLSSWKHIMVSVQLSVAKKTSTTRNVPNSVILDKPYDELTVLDLKKAIAAKTSKVRLG